MVQRMASDRTSVRFLLNSSLLVTAESSNHFYTAFRLLKRNVEK